jgi:negative regulator of sigma E activity
MESEKERVQIYKKLAQERNFEPDRTMTTIDEPLVRQAAAETAKKMSLEAIPNWLALVNFVASVACALACVYAIILTIWREAN